MLAVFLQADWLESDSQRAVLLQTDYLESDSLRVVLPPKELESHGGNQAACLIRFPRSPATAPSRGATW